MEGLRRKLVPWRDAFGASPLQCLLLSRAYFGDKSWREAKGELLDDEGDTPSILPGESVEEPMLLRLPSSKSGEWQELRSDRLETSEDSMVVVPWKSLLGWLSVSISPLRFIGPSMLALMQLIGLWLRRLKRRVGLGIGLGVRPLLLTSICSEGEKHCFFPIPLVGDGAGDTGTKSMRFGDEDADFSRSLSLRLRLSSHDWLICMAAWTSRSWAVSLFITSTPSSCFIWWSLVLGTRIGDEGTMLGLLTTVVLFLRLRRTSLWNTWELSLKPFIMGALLDRLKCPSVWTNEDGISRSSSIFSCGRTPELFILLANAARHQFMNLKWLTLTCSVVLHCCSPNFTNLHDLQQTSSIRQLGWRETN